MVPMDSYFSIAIDPANHLRGLLSLSIDTAPASGDDYLLFYYQDGPGRPPQGIIICLHYCGIGWWSLRIIAIDLADHLRGLLSLSIDTASAGKDDYYYSIIRMDLADHPRGLLFASITVGSADGP